MTAAKSCGRDNSAFRAPSGWIPIALAAAATALLAGYVLTGPHEPNIVVEGGVARRDEAAAARVWQLLMLGQIPFIIVFATVWLPKDLRRALAMLALQAAAFVAAVLPVLILEA